MTTFLLVRHATNDTVGKIFAGRMGGVHLNEEGKAQAQQLSENLAQVAIDAVYASPLERAIETAEPIAKSKGLATIINEDFLELALGDWTNASFEDLHSNEIFQRFNSFRSWTRIPGGEMMLEAQSRIVAGLQKLHTSTPNKVMAIVSHADMIKAAVMFFAGIPTDHVHRIEISPASVTIVQVDDYSARILLMNHTGQIRL